MILIIPDVHGRDFWKDAVKGREDWKIVFLGDYTDPYVGWESITKEQCFESMKEIIEFKKQHPDNVTLLIGNHDLSYIDKRMPKCRHDFERSEKIRNLFMENIDLFDLSYEVQIQDVRYIFSHSGILPEWIRAHELGHISMDDIVNFLNNKFHNNLSDIISWLADVSPNRGGWKGLGSCVWGDVYELWDYTKFKSEHEQISDSFQIVGHSQQEQNPIITDDFACLDCRRAFILNDNGEIKELEDE